MVTAQQFYQRKDVVLMTIIWKPVAQSTLLLTGTFFILCGAIRGEIAVVLMKAIKICLECVGIG